MGTSIRNARLAREMTQEDLASRLGVKQQTVSRWESGDSRPGPRSRAALSNALGIELDELNRLAHADESEQSTGMSIDELDAILRLVRDAQSRLPTERRRELEAAMEAFESWVKQLRETHTPETMPAITYFNRPAQDHLAVLERRIEELERQLELLNEPNGDQQAELTADPC